MHVANSGKLPITHLGGLRLIANVLRKDKQKIMWYNIIIKAVNNKFTLN